MKHHWWWWWWWHDRHRHDLRGDSERPILWTSRVVVVAVAGSSARRCHDTNHALLLLLVGQWRRWWWWVATVAILVFFLFFVGRNLSYLPYSNYYYSSTATGTTSSSSSFQLNQYPSNHRNDDDDDDEDKASPRSASLQLIWHVGPMKTGTTTLQSALREWQDILLRDDQWAYLGPSSFMMTSNSNNNNTQNQVGNLKAPDFAERFGRFLANEFQTRHLNVIVSSEYFSIEFRSEQYRAVQRALAKFTNYQVQIVIGYRPYYEWIPSRYSQAYKYTPQQRSSSSHKRRSKNPQQPATTASTMHDAYPWKDSRGHWKHPVPPMFPTYFAQIDQSEQIFTDHVYDYVQPQFTNITIISLAAQSDNNNNNNNTTDWVATWFCDILRAAHTCQQYSKKLPWQQPQNHSITTTNSTSTSTSSIVNPSRLSSIRADVIGLAAAAQGWIDMVRYARLTVMEATEQYMRHNRTTTETATTTPNGSNSDNTLRANGNHNRLPLICPDSTLLDRLWEQTVAKETRLFHSSSSSSSSGLTVERVTQLRQGFQDFLDDQTYCHVNVTAVLDDPDWRHFLAQFQK